MLLLIVQTGAWQFWQKNNINREIKGKTDHKLILTALSGIFFSKLIYNSAQHITS